MQGESGDKKARLTVNFSKIGSNRRPTQASGFTALFFFFFPFFERTSPDSVDSIGLVGKIAEKLRQVKENGVRNIAMVDACQKFDSFRALEQSMQQKGPQPHLTQQEIEDIRRRSESRRETIVASLGHDNPLLTHSIMRRRTGLAAVLGGSGSLSSSGNGDGGGGELIAGSSLEDVGREGGGGGREGIPVLARGRSARTLFHITEESNGLNGDSLETSMAESSSSQSRPFQREGSSQIANENTST